MTEKIRFYENICQDNKINYQKPGMSFCASIFE